jgi:hypothetical protein
MRVVELPEIAVKRAKFVAILFLALTVRFNIVVNICHLLSFYFLWVVANVYYFNPIGLTHFHQINFIRHVCLNLKIKYFWNWNPYLCLLYVFSPFCRVTRRRRVSVAAASALGASSTTHCTGAAVAPNGPPCPRAAADVAAATNTTETPTPCRTTRSTAAFAPDSPPG